jgi:hypothetical protein
MEFLPSGGFFEDDVSALALYGKNGDSVGGRGIHQTKGSSAEKYQLNDE